MKQRVISAIIALAITIPIIISGGYLFIFGSYALAVLSLRELMNVREEKSKIPDFIKFISYLLLTVMIFSTIEQDSLNLFLDFRIIAAFLLTLLTPVIFYHNDKKYGVEDAFFMIGSLFFLSASFALLILVRNVSLALLVYLLVITVITDTYAYVTGMLIGRTKLLESISPKKTIEGLMGGLVFGTLFASVFYITVIDPNASYMQVILITSFLSILGEIGDLVFSSIKRKYNKKDFGTIMPGHGGVLDRFDSLIFVLLGVLLFIGLI